MLRFATCAVASDKFESSSFSRLSSALITTRKVNFLRYFVDLAPGSRQSQLLSHVMTFFQGYHGHLVAVRCSAMPIDKDMRLAFSKMMI